MFKSKFNLRSTVIEHSRNVVAVAICLAGFTLFSGCEKENDPVNPPPPPPTEAIELISPITVNTTLKDLGLPVDYIYKGSGLLQVRNNAVLTIEPGVTIQFTDKTGGMEIRDGATIQAVGTAEKRIGFVGATANKGCWDNILITTTTDNQFKYVDMTNGGSRNDAFNHPAIFSIENGQVGISHCKVSGGLVHGIVFYDNCRITAFDNNTVENCDDVPVWIRGAWKLLEKFDMTSVFTNNTKQYVQIAPNQSHKEDATISQTSVPYYFSNSCDYLNAKLTINEGVTIYMGDGVSLTGYSAPGQGRLVINGTAAKKVKFTRLPGTTQHWQSVYFNGLTGSEINHCIFEYGGKNENSEIILIADNADLTLNNVEINNSYNYGVRLGFGGCKYRLTHNNVTFKENYKGNVLNTCVSPNEVLDELP